MKIQMSVARDFSRFPAGATRQDSPYSGQAFYEDLLEPLLKKAEEIEIDLDGTLGYGSSWLKAAFGNVDKLNFNKITFVSRDTSLVVEIKEYVEKNEIDFRKEAETLWSRISGYTHKLANQQAVCTIIERELRRIYNNV